MTDRQTRLLRIAFITGAIVDGLAVVPMLVPSLARLTWGFDGSGAPYRFAMGYGATLMTGWTVLLIWAARRPRERRFLAGLTAVLIYGLVATEVVAVATGAIAPARMIGTWLLQAGLIGLFATAYHGWGLSRDRRAAA